MIGLRRQTLTSAQAAALVTGGAFATRGSLDLNTVPLVGGFWVIKAESPDGVDGLFYDATNGKLDLYARGAVAMSTALLSTDPASGTFNNWVYGDVGKWEVKFDPVTGGAGSMRIRWGVNNSFGADTLGAATGAALAECTSGVACATADADWSAGANASPFTANVDATGVWMGDSIIACYRSNVPGTGTFLGATSALAMLAQTGATITQQQTTYNASKYKTQSGLAWGACQLGINDINAGATAAVTLGRLQTLYDTWAADHPGVPFFVMHLSPARFGMSAANYQVYLDVNTGISGGGGSPLAGADLHAVSAHVALMSDANGSLLYRYSTNDHSHPNELGRPIPAAALRAAIVAQGITP